jgi:hypothetical protein
MTWPSAVAMRTLPLATAGEDVTGEAASYFPDFLSQRSIEIDADTVELIDWSVLDLQH